MKEESETVVSFWVASICTVRLRDTHTHRKCIHARIPFVMSVCVLCKLLLFPHKITEAVAVEGASMEAKKGIRMKKYISKHMGVWCSNTNVL